eukprot:SAG11_NODE_654_length_7909_cov_7.701280_6_plen_277_part_00
MCVWPQASHAWLYVTDEPESPPVAVWVVVLCFLLLPTRARWSLWSSRRRLLRTFVRVLGAGFFPVMWRDVLLANIVSSLVKPLVDINHFVCYSMTESFFEEGDSGEALKLNVEVDACGCLPGFGWDNSSRLEGSPGECVEGFVTHGVQDCQTNGQDIDYCNQYFQLDALVTFLPYWFRFCQQLRRFGASNYKSKRDLVNAAKYFSSLCVVSFSWADHIFTAEYAGHAVGKWDIFASPYKVCWAVSVVICATFKLIWCVWQHVDFCVTPPANQLHAF